MIITPYFSRVRVANGDEEKYSCQSCGNVYVPKYESDRKYCPKCDSPSVRPVRRKNQARVSFTEGDLVEDIRHEMEEIKHRFGEEFTEGGEPQVLLNNKTHEVWVSTGDWHGTEVVREIFDELSELAGVANVDGESESWPEGYNYGKGESDWEKVYP